MKRFYIEYESDKIVCKSNKHHYCSANTLKSAVSIAKRIKKELANENARNIKVYDIYSGYLDMSAPVVYEVI